MAILSNAIGRVTSISGLRMQKGKEGYDDVLTFSWYYCAQQVEE
jgi:hypothetical protein